MNLVVTFRFDGMSEVQKCMVSSIKIDGKGHLILYGKDRRMIEKLTVAELRDIGIESVRSQGTALWLANRFWTN